MDSLKMERNIEALNDLREDARRIQRNGLPFMLSSVILWSMISLVQFLDISQVAKNTFTFGTSMFLFPLSLLFAKILKANFIQRTKNPVNALGFMMTMNQMLYLLIVMWVYSAVPEKMVMVHAMVFGAHLLPYSWLYSSRAYLIYAIAVPFIALLLGINFGGLTVAAVMAILEIVFVLILFREVRQQKE